jgi:hypothetical protein
MTGARQEGQRAAAGRLTGTRHYHQIVRAPALTRQQGWAVVAPTGTVVLAQDAVYLRENLDDLVLAPTCWDQRALLRSFGRLRGLRRIEGATIVPGHDIEIWDELLHAPEHSALTTTTQRSSSKRPSCMAAAAIGIPGMNLSECDARGHAALDDGVRAVTIGCTPEGPTGISPTVLAQARLCSKVGSRSALASETDD